MFGHFGGVFVIIALGFLDLVELRFVDDAACFALAQHLGKPLTKVPDPFGTHASFGEHNNARLRAFLDHRHGPRSDPNFLLAEYTELPAGYNPRTLAWAAALCLAGATTPGTAATYTWTGGGTTNNWSNAGNWSGTGDIPNFSTLRFAGTQRLNAVNNLPDANLDRKSVV